MASSDDGQVAWLVDVHDVRPQDVEEVDEVKTLVKVNLDNRGQSTVFFWTTDDSWITIAAVRGLIGQRVGSIALWRCR